MLTLIPLIATASALNTIPLTRSVKQSDENRARIAAREQGKGLWKRADGSEAFANGAPLDGIYLGTIELGTPGQSFLLQFDTGSADLWVYGPDANTTAHPKLSTSASSTFVGSTTPWSVTYGDGDTTSGFVVKDTLSIGGFNIPSSGFSIASFTTERLEAQKEDGLIGLGFTKLANNEQTTFMENLIAGKGGSLDNPYFSLFLERDYTIDNRVKSSSGTSSDADSTGGELCIGCANTEHYDGSLSFVPVTSQYYWAVDCAGLTYKGKTISGTSHKALIDSGSSIISLPPSVIQAYADGIGATIQSAGVGSSAYVLVVQCADLAVMKFGFEFGGNIYDVAPLDLFVGNDGSQCGFVLAATDAQDADGQPLAIVGDTFIKNWYTVFAYNSSTSHSIGFGRAIQPKDGTLDGSGLPGTSGTAGESGGSVTSGSGTSGGSASGTSSSGSSSPTSSGSSGASATGSHAGASPTESTSSSSGGSQTDSATAKGASGAGVLATLVAAMVGQALWLVL